MLRVQRVLLTSIFPRLGNGSSALRSPAEVCNIQPPAAEDKNNLAEVIFITGSVYIICLFICCPVTNGYTFFFSFFFLNAYAISRICQKNSDC